MNSKHYRLISALEPFSFYTGFRELLEADDVSSIMINPDGIWWVRRGGEVMPCKAAFAGQILEDGLQDLAKRNDKRLDDKHPLLEVELPGGGWLAVVYPPIVSPNPAITIQKQLPVQCETGKLLR